MGFRSWLRTTPMIAGIYITNLLISFHYFFVVYVNSSFISEFIDERFIGYLYIFGSILSVLLFVHFISLLRCFGNVRLTILLLSLEAVALGMLAVFDVVWILLISFTIHLIVSPMLFLNLDIFLEKGIKEEAITGSARGLFLTMLNIAQVSAPIIMGVLLVQDEYWKAYITSMGFLVLALLTVIFSLRSFKDPHYSFFDLRQMKERLLGSATFYNVFAAQFLLRFFYAWMVIYTPLYLHSQIGFAWSEIGVIFTIMLIPFLLLEFPLGRIADRFSNERYMMIFGFVVLGCTVACIPLLEEPNFFLWTAILFATRIGASFVEVGSESVFFKHVDGKHAKTISMFRAARPASYVLAASVASLTLVVMPLQWSFIVLAGFMFWGITYSRKLVAYN